MLSGKAAMDREVDREFNELTTRILEIIENERGGKMVSDSGINAVADALGDTIINIKELI